MAPISSAPVLIKSATFLVADNPSVKGMSPVPLLGASIFLRFFLFCAGGIFHVAFVFVFMILSLNFFFA
jgi:hypothetical protein